MAMTRKEIGLLRELTSRDSRTLTAEESRQAEELYGRWRLIEPRRMPTDTDVDCDAVIRDAAAAAHGKVDKRVETHNYDAETEDAKRLLYLEQMERLQQRAVTSLRDAARAFEYVEHLRKGFPPGSTDPSALKAAFRSRAVMKKARYELLNATHLIDVILRYKEYLPLKVTEQLSRLYNASHDLTDTVRNGLEPVDVTPKQEYL